MILDMREKKVKNYDENVIEFTENAVFIIFKRFGNSAKKKSHDKKKTNLIIRK